MTAGPADDIAILDTHVHFADQTKNGPRLHWRWLDSRTSHPLLGSLDGIRCARFSPRELWAEARLSGLDAILHVHGTRGAKDPVAETRWISDLAGTSGLPIIGTVAEVQLQQPNAVDILARQAEFPLVRGIRDFGRGDYLDDPAFTASYKRLERYGFVFDWDPRWQDLDKLAKLAGRYPDIRLAVEHCGQPPLDCVDDLAQWRQKMRLLSKSPNVAVKLSGWGMWDPKWTWSSVMPALKHSLDVFGPDRTMFGSNWPLGRLSSSYGDVVRAVHLILAGASDSEREKVLRDSGLNWYNLR